MCPRPGSASETLVLPQAGASGRRWEAMGKGAGGKGAGGKGAGGKEAGGAESATAAAARRARRAERRSEDAALAVAARGGDEDAFRQLVERYQKKVYWIAYDVVLDREEARDIAQETFVRVHAALPSFDESRDFLNWLYRIARNLAIDAFRRRKRRAIPVEDLTTVESAEGLEVDGGTGIAGELSERVAAVLGQMPVEYRLALTLREFHGLSPREIATLTDCTYPTARWRLHRARTLFKKIWERRYGAPTTDELRAT